MTRSNPDALSDRSSRVWIQSAMVSGLVFWAVDRQGSSGMAELEAREAMHGEIHTLRAERDMLRVDSQALADQLDVVERERNQARERIRLSRVADLESSSAVKASTGPVPMAAPSGARVERARPETSALPALEGEIEPAPLDPSAIALFDPRSTELDVKQPDDDGGSVPARVSFQSMLHPPEDQGIALNEANLEQIELDHYESALARSYAEGLWYETLVEVSEFECGGQRGASRTRCMAEVAEFLSPLDAQAVQCILTGNARPDYVHGLGSDGLPTHAVSMEEGALILCDTGLVNH